MGREEGKREKGVVLRPRENGSRGEEGGGGWREESTHVH